MGHKSHVADLGVAGGIATLGTDSRLTEAQVPASLETGQRRELPGEHLLGSVLNYPSSSIGTIGEIQYGRVWLVAGTTIVSMRCFLDQGGTAGRSIRMGIYDQATPASTAGVPVNRVAQTATTATNGLNGTFVTLPLSSSYAVPTTGYYWLAIIADATQLQMAATSASFRAGYLPVKREAGSGTTLPSAAGTLTNPASAVLYVAAVE